MTHADELASQETSFVQFEAQKKALEISAALRDLRQVDIRSLGCRWKHGFQRIFTIKDTWRCWRWGGILCSTFNLEFC